MTSAVRRVGLLAIVSAALFAFSPPVSAGENELFGVTPFPERMDGMDRTTFSIPLETGATFEDAVRIYNRTDETLNLTLYATDADTKLDETISVGLREEEARGVGAWIDLARESVELTPRGEVTVAFRVKVRSADPTPNIGAIVVETGRGLAANAAQRLHVVVRTVPANTETTSTRVRSLVLRSPWVFIALCGLVVAGAVVWVGARRARRPRDVVVPPGELETEVDDAPEASRPVIKRLGADASGARAGVLERVRASAGASRKRDDRPLLADPFLVEIDPDATEIDGTETPGGDGEPSEGAAAPSEHERETRAGTAKASPKPTGRRPSKTKAKAQGKAKASAGSRTRTGSVRSGTKGSAKSKAKGGTVPSKRAGSKARAGQKQEAKFIPLKDL